ncbi:hypothetical protein [Qipengyuania atrilutea]|uniref:Uncharacterized protein n=1 Tax=Qipengyuania atrilutea TaxID=2744473 RepID=A0A850GZR7_9SPHN|nr:hypothetical protein [Actirhodobacter atriluteus]NVD43492.1 hypothetical protein [Actirhodobacter atriluteus]
MNESRISPWVRPLLLIFVGLITGGVALLSGAINVVFPGTGVRFGMTVMQVLQSVPESWVGLLEVMFVTYAIAKTGERGVQAYSSAKYDPPMRPDGDSHV